MELTERQRELCTTSSWDFSDLSLIDVSIAIMRANGVTVDLIRAVDHDIAPGVYPDMRDHGAASAV